jgi:hypothetical protein
LIQRDIVLATRSSGHDDHGESIPRGAPHLHFCHDRMQQAAYALLSEDERVRWHLGIARALVARHAAAGSADSSDFAAAEHYVAALTRVIELAERELVLRLLMAAARAASANGAFEHALRFADAAVVFVAHEEPTTALRLELDVMRHGILFSLARTEAGNAVFARLLAHGADAPALIAEAVARQILTLSHGPHPEEAVLLCLAHAARLGVEHPAEGEWEPALAAEIDALYTMLNIHGVDLFDRLHPIKNPSSQPPRR